MFSLSIHQANHTDLPAIVAIYNQAIHSKNATGDTQDFRVAERQEWFKKFSANEYPLYVAKVENKLVGYCSISPYRAGRKAMKNVAEISYYVDFSFHRKGAGTALVEHAIADCKRIGKKNLVAILLEMNKPSIRLLEKFGFQKWGHFPDIVEMHGKTSSHVVFGLKVSQ